MRVCLVFALLCAPACGSISPAPAPSEIPVAPAPPVPPPLPAPAVRPVSVGFGGVGPASPPGRADAWVAALVEVSSPGAELTGVHVSAIALLDAQGGVVARATAPIDVRVTPQGRAPHDFSAEGTTPFPGVVARGATVLLRVHAPLDTRLEGLSRRAPITRARLEIGAANGATVQVEAPASPWPTG